LKLGCTKEKVRDIINLMTGTPRSPRSVSIIWHMLKFMEVNKEIPKEAVDDFLRVFVVLYLKSEDEVKRIFVQDIESVFHMIKRQETKLFVEREFKYYIFFYEIMQFRHCLSQEKGEGESPCAFMQSV